MAGIWFPLDNTTGRVVSPEVYRDNVDGFNWSNDKLTMAATVFLDESSATATVPIFDFATGSSPGATSFNMRAWVENGILSYSAGRPDQPPLTRGKSSTTLPTGVPVELVITMDPDANSAADRLLFFINGFQETVADLHADNRTSPYYNYQRITVGGYDDGSTVAAGLLVSDFLYSNHYSNNGIPDKTSTSTKDTVWLSDFEGTAEPLLIKVQKNKNNTELNWTIIDESDESKVIWTEGNEPPGFGAGGGDVGGIIIPGNGNTTQVQGTITENDLPVARRVLAITEAQLAVTNSSDTRHAVLDSTISNDIDGSYTLNTSPYEGAVMVLASDNYGELWQPDTACAVGDVIRPSVFQGYVYHCTLAGVTGTSEPVWWFETGSSQTVGTAQFQARPFSRPLAHGPIIPTIIASE